MAQTEENVQPRVNTSVRGANDLSAALSDFNLGEDQEWDGILPSPWELVSSKACLTVVAVLAFAVLLFLCAVALKTIFLILDIEFVSLLGIAWSSVAVFVVYYFYEWFVRSSSLALPSAGFLQRFAQR